MPFRWPPRIGRERALFFERIYDSGLAQASYMVGCQAAGTALVVDPRRDIDIYREIAASQGLAIVGVA